LYRQSPQGVKEKIIYNSRIEKNGIVIPAFDYELQDLESVSTDMKYVKYISFNSWKISPKIKIPIVVTKALYTGDFVIGTNEKELYTFDSKGRKIWDYIIPNDTSIYRNQMITFDNTIEVASENKVTIKGINDNLFFLITHFDHTTRILDVQTGKVNSKFIAKKKMPLPIGKNVQTFTFGYNQSFLFSHENGKFLGIIEDVSYINDLGKGLRDFLGIGDLKEVDYSNFLYDYSENRQSMVAYNKKLNKVLYVKSN